jgi:hypothetical protein
LFYARADLDHDPPICASLRSWDDICVPLCPAIDWRRVSWRFCLGWPWSVILPISTSQEARIAGLSHHIWSLIDFLLKTKSLHWAPPLGILLVTCWALLGGQVEGHCAAWHGGMHALCLQELAVCTHGRMNVKEIWSLKLRHSVKKHGREARIMWLARVSQPLSSCLGRTLISMDPSFPIWLCHLVTPSISGWQWDVKSWWEIKDTKAKLLDSSDIWR